MLYPKEDEDAHRLLFTCRTCQYTEEAVSTCVYRNNLTSGGNETAGVTQDVSSDPTVGVSQTPTMCLLCGCAVFCVECYEPLTPSTYKELAQRQTSARHVRRPADRSSVASVESVFSYAFSDQFDQDPFDEYDEEPMMETDTLEAALQDATSHPPSPTSNPTLVSGC